MKVSIAALLVGASQASSLFDSQNRLSVEDQEFVKFVSEHNKSYGTKAEFEFRLTQFKETYAKVMAHNASNSTSSMAINKFADLTPAEIKQLNGLRRNPQK